MWQTLYWAKSLRQVGAHKMLACVCMVPFSGGMCDTGDLAVNSSPSPAPARSAFLGDDRDIHVDIDHQPHI